MLDIQSDKGYFERLLSSKFHQKCQIFKIELTIGYKYFLIAHYNAVSLEIYHSLQGHQTNRADGGGVPWA